MATTSVYPGAAITYTEKTDKVDLVQSAHINQVQADIKAVADELGLDPAGTQTDLVTRLSKMMAGSGAFAQGTSFPSSPVEGQAFYRTDENTFYTYNGTSWDASGTSGIEIFTADGTFTAPGGVTTVYLTMCGAGGAGGTASASVGGGGGGAGGVLINYPFTVVPGNNYTIDIGTTSGSSTSFDTGGSPLTIPGGSAGAIGTGGNPGSENNGNGGAGGKIGIQGGKGETVTAGTGGGGGGGPFGAGGNGQTGGGGGPGAPGTGYGAGGGGGQASGGNGGSGSPGICIVMY